MLALRSEMLLSSSCTAVLTRSSRSAVTARIAPIPLALRNSRCHSGRVAPVAATTSAQEYSLADQPARFAEQKRTDDRRALNIEEMYDPSSLKGKRVMVTGGNRGIGLALCTELKDVGAVVIAVCRKSSPELDSLNVEQVVEGIDVTDTACMQKMVDEIAQTGPLDVVVNNAGYFYEPEEKLDCLNFEEEMKMIDICALGPLRVTAALVNAGLVASDGKVPIITSQGGSIAWRDVQNPEGGDYGHHMSKAAGNMMGKLLSQELKGKGITVTMLHPGFNKTDMTAKYEEIWAVEGAVDVSVGAKRVLHEIGRMSLEKTGEFVNCEDGLLIPW